MSITKRKVRVEPDKIYVAIDAFVGETFVVKQGQRLRGDHPAVQGAPHLFAQDGADDAELAAARAAAFDQVVQMSEGEAAPPAPAPAIDPKTPLGDLMICVAAILSSSVGPVEQGTIVHKRDPRVAAVPKAFAPLVEQLG